MATTAAAMYRVGNHKADLLRVRNQDVSIFQDAAQPEICVRPYGPNSTPGISCCATQLAAQTAALRGRVWELPAGATYDDAILRLWQPRPDKWYWSPATNIPGSQFIAALRDVNDQFK